MGSLRGDGAEITANGNGAEMDWDVVGSIATGRALVRLESQFSAPAIPDVADGPIMEMTLYCSSVGSLIELVPPPMRFFLIKFDFSQF